MDDPRTLFLSVWNASLPVLLSVWNVVLPILRDHDWMLVIFTGLLAISTLLLWRTTKNDTRILQRAYIAVEPLGIHLMSDASSVIGHVGIKNAGHLPARKLSSVINMKCSKKGNEPEAFFPIERREGKVVIVPGAATTRASSTTIDIQILNKASGASSGKLKDQEEEVFLYVWGSVRYDNGFRRMRTTRFCHRYNWKSSVGYAITKEHARFHEHFNDAD